MNEIHMIAHSQDIISSFKWKEVNSTVDDISVSKTLTYSTTTTETDSFNKITHNKSLEI